MGCACTQELDCDPHLLCQKTIRIKGPRLRGLRDGWERKLWAAVPVALGLASTWMPLEMHCFPARHCVPFRTNQTHISGMLPLRHPLALELAAVNCH